MEKEIEELINAGRAMIDGKGWHEIDGQCSICRRFIAAVKSAQQSVHPTDGELCAVCGYPEYKHSAIGHEFDPAISG